MSSLASALQDIESLLSKHDLTDWHNSLKHVLEDCQNVVTTVGNVMNQNYCLEPSNADGIRGKAKGAWETPTSEPEDIQELRLRMALNVACLGVFTRSLTRY